MAAVLPCPFCGSSNMDWVIPAYQRRVVPICEDCGDDPVEIAEEIRRTIWHEIAHHLGWDDDVLEAREAEKGWR